MLSRSEIDALLGDVTLDGDAAGGPLGAAASDDLSSVMSDVSGARVAAPRRVKRYDFRRPDKFSKDQFRTLRAIHENFARVAGARLSAKLRMAISIQLAEAEQMIFDEYLQQLVLPTQLAVLQAEPLAGPLLLDLDLGLASASVDRMLGGLGRIPPERREPTAIEARLIERVLAEIVGAFNEGWANLQPLDARVTEVVLNPSLLRVVAPSHVVAVLKHEVRMWGQAAWVTVCYPHATLEPLLPRLSGTAWYSQTEGQVEMRSGRDEVEEALSPVGIPLTATLGSAELAIDALANLRPGDVIRFDERIDQPVVISIMDQARAWALPGKVGDRLALRLVSPLQPLEA